ncbi:uncharacterized protein LOC113214964 isoform X2 [Frankliniella occidentalis]|uniref:Uncharacterized protein LOC113214964 isoform X2 n=1 Tax=Frankliniella occidentalis TaxID=133901 RepID=A0A9C6X4T2_FRAOC|nr:uncharacterized protein LOC113214964 isoform X2 [Frankliniella occidentalis]
MVAPTLPATVIALVIIGAALPPVVPFRVLGLFPFQGHSHNIMSKVPLISLDSQPDHPWMHDRVGAINNPSYLFSTNVYHVGPMNLWQRARNTYQLLAAQYLFKVCLTDSNHARRIKSYFARYHVFGHMHFLYRRYCLECICCGRCGPKSHSINSSVPGHRRKLINEVSRVLIQVLNTMLHCTLLKVLLGI